MLHWRDMSSQEMFFHACKIIPKTSIRGCDICGWGYTWRRQSEVSYNDRYCKCCIRNDNARNNKGNKSLGNLTFTWPCIVLNSYNKTIQMHQFLKFVFGMKLYMFRTVPLPIISRFSLYTQQWYMSYRLQLQRVRRIRTDITLCTVKISWWWTQELSETCRVSFQK